MMCIDDLVQDAKKESHFNKSLAILLYVSLRTNASLNHLLVMDAIARGVKTVDEISKVTRLGENEVGQLINDLIAQRLIIGKKERSIKK
jgi:hypothetical protein